MSMLNILITAPSLNENENVSGISTMVRTIIGNNRSSHKFIHYRVGKKDTERKGIGWLFRQLTLAPALTAAVIKNKINLLYLNTDLTKPSILRDYVLFMTARLVLNKKVLLHIHGGHYLMKPPSPRSPFMYMIRAMLRDASLCIVLSEIEVKSIRDNYNVDAVALPNAIEVFKLSDRQKDFNSRLRIIFLGRLVASKGVHVIADALSQLNGSTTDFEFHIYGSGPELDGFLEKLKSVEGLNYSYKGVVKGEEKWNAFRDAHLFLLPSLFGEGLPIAMLEAMGSGCIPIVSDDASITTVVEDRVNGFIVNKGDSKSLSRTIQQLLFDRNTLSRISETAQSTIREKYNIDNYLKRLNHYCATL
jgi:glycosyltransferase involved in cell wall biosynthesis